jgi:restriction system protein
MSRRRRKRSAQLLDDQLLFAVFIATILLILAPWIWKLIIFLVSALVVWIYVAKHQRRMKALRQSGADQIDQMSGREFEERLWLLFKDLGWTVEATPISGDWGADLIISKDGERIAVQAKRYSKPVGVQAIQEAVTAQAKYGCTGSMVVTNNDYTRQARELARHNQTVLWNRERLVSEMLNLATD